MMYYQAIRILCYAEIMSPKMKGNLIIFFIFPVQASPIKAIDKKQK